LSTPFLVGFSRAVLVDLLDQRLIEVHPGREDRVILFVAEFLASVPEGGSLVSSLSKAYLASPDVVELYADDAVLKGVIQDIQSTPAAWVRG
jgi:hypothetical protein